MSPILGILASQNYSRITSSYESIATVTVGVLGTSSITFSSIPSTYTHLQIRGIGRTDRVAPADSAKMKFNSDSGANYAYHVLYGTGSVAAASSSTSTNNVNLDRFASATATSGVFGAIVIDILDYTSTTKNKTVRSLGGVDNNGSGEIDLDSNLYFATPAAITTIDITPNIGTNWVQYSSFALYGIK